MKAMILAAGHGQRMRPLTDHLPKPLVTLMGKPLIVHHLEKLAAADIRDIVINVSHLGEQIQHALGNGNDYGVSITYSFEPEPLETGGGIYQALPLLGDAPFLVISADLYMDYPLLELKQHRLEGLGHLVLVPNPTFNPKGDYSLSPDGKLNNAAAHTYASFGILHPDLFKNCSPGKYSVTPLIREATEKSQFTGELFTGYWHNIGTIKQLVEIENGF